MEAPPTNSVIQLFKLLKSKEILFSVDGHFIGKFFYMSEMFGRYREISFNCSGCIVINISKESVDLEDYFWDAERTGRYCDMKPTTKDGHQRIVGTLLEFLAYAFQKTEIHLSDDATREYKYCPPLHTGFHLVAGLESFYEKMAGFKSPEAVDDARKLARRVPTFPTSRGTTWGEVAKALVDVCKAEKEKITKDDRRAIRIIQASFMDNGGIHYEKPFHGRYRCRIQHADEIHDHRLVHPTNLLPNEVIKKSLSIDILT
jgi:hypothetical protein